MEAMALEHLQPQLVWKIFEEVFLQTPHESKHEDKIRAKIKAWVADTAKKSDPRITVSEDEIGNLLIKKPASTGYEGVPPVLLQGHMDMVCVANEPFDFDNSPIIPKITDDKKRVTASGTSLGADDGIGCSAALACLIDDDPEFHHGPIEILVTVDEETGLTGAFELDVGALGIQSRRMLNLDSEEIDIITIGSAGGGDFEYRKDLAQSDDYTQFSQFYALGVQGLKGGHSGGDIHLPRANANKLIARVLSKLPLAKIDFVIADWHGGTKHNAICRNSKVVFGVKAADLPHIQDILKAEIDAILAYYQASERPFEPNLNIILEDNECLPFFSAPESAAIVSTANLIPSRAITISHTIEGLTETSNNLAIINTDADGITLKCSSRSSVMPELHWVRDQLTQLAQAHGWQYTLKKVYPGWNPEPEHKFTQFVKNVCEQQLGKPVELGAVHGGLETGVIGDKIPGIAMVSIGPDIHNPHSPDEYVEIESVGIFYRTVKTILKLLKDFA